jgi:hypothetical protein
VIVLPERLRIVVLGYIVRGPVGGMAWHHLHYVRGLRDLGHDVVFIEDSGDDEWCCYDPTTHTTGPDPRFGLGFAADAFRRLGLDDRWAYHDALGTGWHGPLGERALDYCRSADVLINVSGVNPVRPWLEGVPRRVLVDTDPGFAQIRQLTDPEQTALALQHNAFVTFGANVGHADSLIPDSGVTWKPTRQPIWLRGWPVSAPQPGGRFTTVMQWESYAALEYAGHTYGMKSSSFHRIEDLPGKVDQELEIALGGSEAPRDALEAKGWIISDPLRIARDPWSYRSFIEGSKAEFSVAKHGYVESRSGWFSERTANYLATGRPAVVEDTGFPEWLPTGSGVLAFSTRDEAVAGIEEVAADYDAHSRAARELAEEFFDSRSVLTDLLEQVAGPVGH